MTNLLFIFLLMLLKIEGHEEGTCPNICVCKWKGGKQTVECRNLSLTKIPESTDSSTQVLDISGNNLQILQRDTFLNARLQNLQKVYMRSCRIRHIDDNAFKGLSNLIELDLSHNLLTVVPTATFKTISSLRDLTLSSNLIHKIENHAFHYVSNLVKLDLSHCRIEKISPKAFDGLDLLQLLKINGNNLSELHENLIGTLKGLHGIEMHDNPWYCDCKMRVAKMWLTENNIPLLDSPVCSGGPRRVLDRKFSEMQLDDFACRPQMLQVIQNIKGYSKRNVTILCRTNAIPTATIRWYWNNRLLENSSIFGSHQRIFIYESGKFSKQSELIFINAQEIDSTELYCVAENRAGSSETNFTLHITVSNTGMIFFGTSPVNSATSYLIILVLVMAIIIILLLVRVKRNSLLADSKAINQINVPPDLSPTTTNIERNHRKENKKIGSRIENGKIEFNKNNEQIINLENSRTINLGHSMVNNENIGNGGILSSALYSTTSSIENPDLINHRKQKEDVTANIAITTTTTTTNTIAAAATTSFTTTPTTNTTDRNNPHHLQYIENSSTSIMNKFLDPKLTGSSMELIYTEQSPLMDSLEMFKLIDRHSYSNLVENSSTELIGSDSNLLGYDHQKSSKSSLPTYSTPTDAKTIKVWQNGGVSVLPPVSTLKRILTHNNRNSPDEGYQEGCGTDV